MKKIELFKHIIACYFHQDFDIVSGNIHYALQEIISDHRIDELITLANEIEYILNVTENEKELENLLVNKFDLQIMPQAKGIDMNSCSELLEYIRDKIKLHLEAKGGKINDENNNI